MKKYLTRILTLVMALAMALSVNTLPASAAYEGWTQGQIAANTAATLVKDVGGNRYAANAALSAYWYSQGGRNTSSDYYYDSYTNTRYYANGATASGDSYGYYGSYAFSNGRGYIASDGNYVFPDGSYTDGVYMYYWSATRNQYYRFTNESGNKVYDSPIRYKYGTSGNNSGYTYNGTNNGNQVGYNYSYAGKGLYAGIITGIDSYINTSEAVVLAKAIHSYADGQSLLTKSQFAWAVLNCKGSITIANMMSSDKWPLYNANAGYTTEELNLAKDILFREVAEKAGNSMVGRTLPSNYLYVRNENGSVYFRIQDPGANYTTPDQGTWSQYHSPY